MSNICTKISYATIKLKGKKKEEIANEFILIPKLYTKQCNFEQRHVTNNNATHTYYAKKKK